MVNHLPVSIQTAIEGLFLLNLDIRQDSRGWFEEAWQQEKFAKLLPLNFKPLQQNISFNELKGTLRGLHAEPWDKYVTVAAGKVFCAWVDLRDGASFGTVETAVLEPGKGAFIPSGVANGYQTLEDGTSYVYLVNGHWNPSLQYRAVHPFDQELQIQWPIPENETISSPKDLTNPSLREITPSQALDGIVFGAQGQLGRRLVHDFPGLKAFSRGEFDISLPEGLEQLNVSSSSLILNAAAFTAVDASQTAEGMAAAYSSNVRGVKVLADISLKSGATLVHYSSDYVFDGSKNSAYSAQDVPNPINVYGLSKAAGEAIASMNPKTYIFRTSWVFGDGDNFVLKMLKNALRGQPVSVVDDQFGRPTSTGTLSQATRHAIHVKAPFGIYHISNGGPLASWYDVARFIFSCVAADTSLVSRASTKDFVSPLTARRPINSDLGVSDLPQFEPEDWRDNVKSYVNDVMSEIDLSKSVVTPE